MGVIHRLDERLVDQIAAGEVVERPASVVKELLENALDAGATTLRVELEGGGLGLIRVCDDGVGMTPEDAALAPERHATSKIRALSDLTAIETLGFRGEALPSIASVSRFELVTRTKDALAGTRVRIDGGVPAAIDEVGAPPGTTITVRDLFHNVPARRKFLKSAQTEQAHVAEACLRVALSRPGLRLTLEREGKRWREHLPAPDLAARARQLLSAVPLSRIEGEREGVRLLALLSAPEHAQTGSGHLHVFVLGRPVRDRAIARALAFGYGSVLSGGRMPVGAVYIDLDPARLDVNVHPQKAEVRFSDARVVYDALSRIVAAGMGTRPFERRGPTSRGVGFWDQRLGGLGAASSPEPMAPLALEASAPLEADPWGLAPTPGASGALAEAPSAPGVGPALAYASSPGVGPALAYAPPAGGPPVWGAALADGAGRALPVSPGGGPLELLGSPLRFLAQVRRTFLLCESDTALLVLDQHAADERVRYARLLSAYRGRTIASQRLLLPERVELSAREVALLEERQGEIAALGLDLAALGETTVAVRAVPALVARAAPERLVRDLAAELSFEGSRAFGDRVERVLATMACHGSIRAGDALSPAECEALVRAVAAVDELGSHCPHGRPILFQTSWDELGRRVGR